MLANSRTQQRPLDSAETDGFLDFTKSLPSYRALADSVDQLSIASEHLLRAAAKDDRSSLSARADAYRQLVQQVRDQFELLASRVGHDQATTAFETLQMDVEMGFYWLPLDHFTNSEVQALLADSQP